MTSHCCTAAPAGTLATISINRTTLAGRVAPEYVSFISNSGVVELAVMRRGCPNWSSWGVNCTRRTSGSEGTRLILRYTSWDGNPGVPHGTILALGVRPVSGVRSSACRQINSPRQPSSRKRYQFTPSLVTPRIMYQMIRVLPRKLHFLFCQITSQHIDG